MVAAPVPIAAAVTMIEVVSVSMGRALVVVETAAAPILVAAVAVVDPRMVAVKLPVAAVAMAAIGIAVASRTVERIAAFPEQPPGPRWPQTPHAPCDHYGYASIYRAPLELLRL